MTEQTTEQPEDATEAPQDAPEQPETTPEGIGAETTPEAAEQPQEIPEDDGDKRRSGEAAKYRTQLRAAEATIADHESHIAELQQFVIAGLVSDRIADPAVFGKLVERDAWAGDDGRIDLHKLDAAIEQLITDHPSLKPAKLAPRTSPRPNKGEPIGAGTPPKQLSAIDRAFPKAGVTMQNLLERRPEVGTAGDTMQQRNKTRRVGGKIGGEDG